MKYEMRLDTIKVMIDLQSERDRQVEKWGVQNHDDGKWLLILMEEIGEASKDILENKDKETVRKELVQCAAVLVAWIENIDRNLQKI